MMPYLRNRHVIVVDWCCTCKKSEESIDHLLLHYDVAIVWDCMGHSLKGERFVGELEGKIETM